MDRRIALVEDQVAVFMLDGETGPELMIQVEAGMNQPVTVIFDHLLTEHISREIAETLRMEENA